MNQTTYKINTDIVSTTMKDKPLIFISEEAINLKRDNDNYKKEIERLNNIINEIDKEITELFLGSALKNDTKVFNVLYHLGVKIKKLEGVDKE